MTVRFRLIPNVPKELFHVEAGKAAREIALDELAEEAKALFEGTTATWQHNVVFVIRQNKDGRTIGTRGDTGKIFTFVDAGTRSHVIRARNAAALMWRSPFTPKTQPGNLFARQGSLGQDWHAAQEVNHPGTEPRGFSEIIQARMDRRFKIRYQQVFDAIIHG